MVGLDRSSRGVSAMRGAADGLETGSRFQGYIIDGIICLPDHYTNFIIERDILLKVLAIIRNSFPLAGEKDLIKWLKNWVP